MELQTTMDIGLARTFLAICETGNFVKAADQLNITQSTVSARIKALEQQMSCRLFVRNKAGASLTNAGRRFRKHAELLVRTVEQAQHAVGLPTGFSASIVVRAGLALWEGLRWTWLSRCGEASPVISVMG